MLVPSFQGDRYYALDYNPRGNPAFAVRAKTVTTTQKPQLPSNATLLTRGALKGTVIVSEVTGLRRLRFEPDGKITDLGLFDLGGGVENLTGTMGVQP